MEDSPITDDFRVIAPASFFDWNLILLFSRSTRADKGQMGVKQPKWWCGREGRESQLSELRTLETVRGVKEEAQAEIRRIILYPKEPSGEVMEAQTRKVRYER